MTAVFTGIDDEFLKRLAVKMSNRSAIKSMNLTLWMLEFTDLGYWADFLDRIFVVENYKELKFKFSFPKMKKAEMEKMKQFKDKLI